MKIDIKKIAALANLKLKDSELPKFEKQLNEVIGYIEQLNAVKTENVKITSQVTGLENVVREDKSAPSLTQEEALSGSKSNHNGLFKVDAILAED